MRSKQRALDSNIILRFLLQDDINQCTQVDQLFQQASQNGERFWISSQVLLECIWVLESYYQVTRSDILLCFERLADSTIFELEHAQAIPHFITSATHHKNKTLGDLSDLLIATINAKIGATPTLTFDKKACKAAPNLFQLL